MLQTALLDARVLDLFAGSGALGIEALSRGAVSATFVDAGRRSIDGIEGNLADLGLEDRAHVVVGDAARALLSMPPGGPFDVVLVDPPYDLGDDDVTVLLERLRPWLSDEAIVVVERGHRDVAPTFPDGLRAREPRRYGAAAMHLADVVPATP